LELSTSMRGFIVISRWHLPVAQLVPRCMPALYLDLALTLHSGVVMVAVWSASVMDTLPSVSERGARYRASSAPPIANFMKTALHHADSET
jgi:hypothetical protein